MPAVSVIIAVYNCADYIVDSVESALAQTFRDFEVIVVDGGSTDGTVEQLQPYLDRIKFMVQTGKGVANARNEAIKASRGDYIAILDADDKWLPRKLEVQMSYLREHPEIGLLFSDEYYYEADGSYRGRWFKGRVEIYTGYVFDKLFENNFVGALTTVAKRECFEKVGYFNERLFYAEDTEMWLRIAKEYQIGYIDEPLAVCRFRPESRSLEFEKHYRMKTGILLSMLKKYPDYFQDNPDVLKIGLSNHYFKFGYRYFEAGSLSAARKQFSLALKYKPFDLKTWIYRLACCLPPAFLPPLKRLKRLVKM
jgi:glycosyltransferase involved in cell wall biosynthesis